MILLLFLDLDLTVLSTLRFWNLLSAEKLHQDNIELMEHDYWDRVGGQTTPIRLRHPSRANTRAGNGYSPSTAELKVMFYRMEDLEGVIRAALSPQHSEVDEIVLDLQLNLTKPDGLANVRPPRRFQPNRLHDRRRLSHYLCNDLAWPPWNPPANKVKKSRHCLHKCDGHYSGFGGGPSPDKFEELKVCWTEDA